MTYQKESGSNPVRHRQIALSWPVNLNLRFPGCLGLQIVLVSSSRVRMGHYLAKRIFHRPMLIVNTLGYVYWLEVSD